MLVCLPDYQVFCGLLGTGVIWDLVGIDACNLLCSVPGPIQPVQGAELWGVILPLQANTAVHVGWDKDMSSDFQMGMMSFGMSTT